MGPGVCAAPRHDTDGEHDCADQMTNLPRRLFWCRWIDAGFLELWSPAVVAVRESRLFWKWLTFGVVDKMESDIWFIAATTDWNPERECCHRWRRRCRCRRVRSLRFYFYWLCGRWITCDIWESVYWFGRRGLCVGKNRWFCVPYAQLV